MDRPDQCINFCSGVIEGQRGPGGGRHAEALHHRHGAVVARADRDPLVIEKVITESVRLTARVVSADEREGGLRQVLNLGHTIGHALEAETRYTQLLHGEAVAWGMIAATHVAKSTGRLDGATRERIIAAILGFGKLPRMKVQTKGVLNRLLSDKKTRQGVVHFVLPTQIGRVEITSDVPAEVVRSAVDEIRKLAQR